MSPRSLYERRAARDMIVECKSCNTRFRIGDDKVTVKGVKVRCSKCQHTFVVRKPSEPVVTAPEHAEKTQVAAPSALIGGSAKTMQLFAVQPADIRTGQHADSFDLDAPIRTDPFSVPDTRGNQAPADPAPDLAPTNPLGSSSPPAPFAAGAALGASADAMVSGGEGAVHQTAGGASDGGDLMDARRELFGSASQWSADKEEETTQVEPPPDPFSFAPPQPPPDALGSAHGADDGAADGADPISASAPGDLFAGASAPASTADPFSAAPPAAQATAAAAPDPFLTPPAPDAAFVTEPAAAPAPAPGPDPFLSPTGPAPEASNPFAALGMAPQPGAALHAPVTAPPSGDPFAAFAQNPPTAPSAGVDIDPFGSPPELDAGPDVGADPLASAAGAGEPQLSQDMFASLGLPAGSSADVGLPFEQDADPGFDGTGADQQTRVRQVDDDMLKMLATYSQAEQKATPQAQASGASRADAAEIAPQDGPGAPRTPLSQVIQAVTGAVVTLGLLVGIYAFRGGEFEGLSLGRFWGVVLNGTQGLVDHELSARDVFVSYYPVDDKHRLVVVSGEVENHGEGPLPGVKIRAWVEGDDGTALSESEAYAGGLISPLELVHNKTAEAANRALARKVSMREDKLGVGASWPFAVVLDGRDGALRMRDVKIEMRASDGPLKEAGHKKNEGAQGLQTSEGHDKLSGHALAESAAAPGDKKDRKSQKRRMPARDRGGQNKASRHRAQAQPKKPDPAPPPPPPPPPPPGP